MKYASVLYDTSVYISYRKHMQPGKLAGWYSAVVLAELLISTDSKKEQRSYHQIALKYERAGRLLIPTLESWRQAGLIVNQHLNALSRTSKTRQRPKLTHPEKQNLIRDALIAVTAKQHGVTVISDNVDFPLIQRYYKFKYLPAVQFFAL